jgi:RNA polymerase sigma factor (sigma-70 family)
MADAQRATVLQHLRRLLGPRGASGLTDAQLLERFVTAHDEAAFEVLVWRHAVLVMSVCRRVLHHEQDAEDAFQATFLAFARKAGSVGKRQALSSWLYKVAYRVALAVRARAARRARQETPLVEAPVDKHTDRVLWRDLRPVLDEEVSGLPDKYRVPFLLCCLEGLTTAQAAQQIGCPQGTVATRLARARERLRVRLTRRGLALSGATFAPVLAPEAAGATVSGPLALATVHAALRFAAGQAAAGVGPARIGTLAEGVLQAMFLTKLKIAAAVLVAVGALGTGGGFLSYHALATGANAAQRQGEPPRRTGPNAPEQPAAAKDADVERVLDQFRAARPDPNALAIFQLDWVPTLAEAKDKAAWERRPILLAVVTNSYGNLYTGHC